MRDAVLGLLPNADAIVMAAAVADYRPIETREHKIKKRDAGRGLDLRVTETPDTLKEIIAARRARSWFSPRRRQAPRPFRGPRPRRGPAAAGEDGSLAPSRPEAPGASRAL